MLHRFGERTPTNRAHFLSWLNHQIGFALRALDPEELDSFDFVRLQSVPHLVLPLSSRCLWAD